MFGEVSSSILATATLKLHDFTFFNVIILTFCIFFSPQVNIEFVERFAFYERAKKAYAIVLTGYVTLLFLYKNHGFQNEACS